MGDSVSAETRRMVRDLLAAVAGMVDDPDRARGYASETVGAWRDEHAVGGLDPVEVLWLAEGEVDRLRRAVGVLRAAVDDLFLADVAERGPVRLGDSVFRAGTGRRRRIVDRAGLVAWLGDAVASVFRLDDSNLRVTALEAEARRRAAAEHPGDPDGAERTADAAVTTFLDWEDEPPRLERVPVSRAAWAARLTHGERRH